MRKFIFLLLLNLFFSGRFYSQEKHLSAIKIDELLKNGNIYFKKADFANSLKVLRVAIHESKTANNDSLSAYICNRIGRNFQELSEFSKATEFFNEGLVFAEKAKRPDIAITIEINLGITNSIYNRKYFDSGIKYFEKALAYSIKNNNKDDISLINFNLAWAYFFENRFEEGSKYLKYLNQNIPKKWDNDFLISLNMLNGMYNSHIGNDFLAEKYFTAGVNSGRNFSFKADKQYLFEEYSKFLSKKGDFKNAYKYILLTNKINDSLFSKNKLSSAIVQAFNIEAQSYKSTLKQFQEEKVLNEKNLLKSKLINILAVVLSVILIILLFMLNKNAIKNIQNNEKLSKRNSQLKIAIDKATEANQVKSQFVSTISHELRTPLYGVIGVTDIIYSENKDLVNNKHLEALKFSANYLLSLINDILQISKIEESKIVLDNTTFNIYNEVNAICNSLQFIANKNNIVIETKIDENIPELIVGDQTRLSQILMNLLTNALKFTKNGIVSIELKLESAIENLHFINFKIIDSGVGIAQENQTKIFDKFTQIKQNEDDYQGTGLGLSIVKKLIHLFKSEIFLESEIDKGSTFSFTIGFEKANQTVLNEVQEQPIDLDIRILVVEDNKINQLVTKKIIQSNGQYCKIVSGGFEAIELLKTEHFDTILMDINMPEINGFETSLRIREMGISIPIIALTAFNIKQVEQDAELSGINAVLVKPFEQSKLFEIIKTELNKKNAD